MITPQQLVAEARAQIREVDCATAQQLLAQGTLCVDVRESGEHDAERLHGAISLPRGVIEFRIGEHPACGDKGRALLLYCKTGGRSALAALNLQRMGYSNVVSLAGGIDAWRSLGLPLDRDSTRYGS